MKKIGFVDYYISEWHANNYPVWIKELDCGYEVTHAWAELDVSPVDGRTTTQWCDDFGIEACNSIDDLCNKCDVIVILAPSNPEKHLGYAKEVLKFGKPTYIDKTFAPNLAEAQEIFDMAKRYRTPFFSTSAPFPPLFPYPNETLSKRISPSNSAATGVAGSYSDGVSITSQKRLKPVIPS